MDSSAAPPAVDRPSAWVDALTLVGVAGVAITQPVLDLMGRNPEFFVAGRYTTSQIVEFGVLVAVVPSVVVVALFALARLAHARAGTIVHRVLLAALGALFGNVLLRGLGGDGFALAILAGVAAAVATVLLVRARAGRLLLTYLAAANVLFLFAFLVISPVSGLLSGSEDEDALGTVSVPVPAGPVVVIVFDELPLPTLMRSDGTINAERYPSFARLAAGSTWFRNASTHHNRTERAVPELVTGTVLDERVMPTYASLPHNLLALMSTSVPVERYEAVTDLCPRRACAPRDGQPLRQAIEDALVVFGHRVLPPSFRDDLAPIDDAWGSFGDGLGAATPAAGEDLPADADPLELWHGADRSERDPTTQARRLVENALEIDGAPALHFIHVVIPHAPWFITPWATRLMPPMPEWQDEVPGRLNGPWSSLIRYQRHSLQTGAADVALGQVLDHLEDTGVWDDATVLVTADHGTSTIPPDVMRVATKNNLEEVYRVPLFLKVPDQTDPEVRDDVAQSIDVLPTLIDVLGAETDWEMDGHSLLDGTERTVAPLVRTDVDALLGVVRRHEADFPFGYGWTALAAVGEHAALVGEAVDDLEVGPPSLLEWTPSNEAAFADLPGGGDGEVPQLMTGTIASPRDAEPPALVIAVNGTVAGVTGGYERTGAGWSFSSMLGPFLRRGANEIAAYEVIAGPVGPTLHPVG